jgi:formate dehydrogenase subunit gamma
MRRLREFVSNREQVEPKDVGVFNAGQKLYFWTIAISAIIFLITGLFLWFDHMIPRWVVAVSYVLHDIGALIMLAGFIIHIYEGTAAAPGTFQSMVDGTVTEEWAWTHHPAWYEEVTGRDPREDYERARERQAERRRAIEAWEREQDTRDQAARLDTPGDRVP